jgi:diguanylate cyclase (GGDEF)-like protein
MLDIDLFKSVNDRYVHVVGDEILQLVANTLSGNLLIMTLSLDGVERSF